MSAAFVSWLETEGQGIGLRRYNNVAEQSTGAYVWYRVVVTQSPASSGRHVMPVVRDATTESHSDAEPKQYAPIVSGTLGSDVAPGCCESDDDVDVVDATTNKAPALLGAVNAQLA